MTNRVQKSTKKREILLSRASWIIAGVAVLPALTVWLQGMGPGFVGLAALDAYQLFPLLGLIAFALMWSHYMVGALRVYLNVDREVTRRYREVTGWIVLGAIILHPGILIYSLWRDGMGLPPNSYLNYYVAPTLKWAAAFGVVALLAFLAYELHRWFEHKKWWWIVQRANDVAMVLILVHGFKLGGDFATGWFKIVWLMYAETFVAALLFLYYREYKRRRVVG